MHIPEYTVILIVHIVVKTPILCSFSFIFTYAIQSCVLCPYVLAVFACVQLSKRRKAEYVKTVHIHSCFSGLFMQDERRKKTTFDTILSLLLAKESFTSTEETGNSNAPPL